MDHAQEVLDMFLGHNFDIQAATCQFHFCNAENIPYNYTSSIDTLTTEKVVHVEVNRLHFTVLLCIRTHEILWFLYSLRDTNSWFFYR